MTGSQPVDAAKMSDKKKEKEETGPKAPNNRGMPGKRLYFSLIPFK